MDGYTDRDSYRRSIAKYRSRERRPTRPAAWASAASRSSWPRPRPQPHRPQAPVVAISATTVVVIDNLHSTNHSDTNTYTHNTTERERQRLIGGGGKQRTSEGASAADSFRRKWAAMTWRKGSFLRGETAHSQIVNTISGRHARWRCTAATPFCTDRSMSW
jgi:hypothetical protein